MNYDPSKLPKLLPELPYACRDLVYIGKGTDPSIADIYNNGIAFEVVRINNGELLSSSPCFGDSIHVSYYVAKDSPILEKMFPLEIKSSEEILEEIKKEVSDFIVNKLNDSLITRGKLINKMLVLKAIHDEIISMTNENLCQKVEQKELSEDIVI